MEMPPLFSNGVVGQTTSHLVSRETDLSLNSLLSRSQRIFGHTNAAASVAATLASTTQTTNHQPTPKMYPSMQHSSHSSQNSAAAAVAQR